MPAPLPLALVIEDERTLADIFTHAIRRAGFTVETFDDGQAALERLAVTVPALVVLDLQLPSVGGEQILQQIRADQRLALLKVILATADDRLAEHLRADSDLVLLKPISFSQLRDLAARLHPSSPSAA